MTTFTSSSDLTTFDPNKRANFSLGMIVGADDLSQDQRYLTARDERHQRSLHGWGVTSGLLIDFDGTELRVHPGAAVDGEGRTICVGSTQCADVLGWLNGLDDDAVVAGTIDVWVLLCFADCETDLLPVPSGPCQTLDDSLLPSRVLDSFELQLSLVEPTWSNDTAHPSFGSTLTELIDDTRTEEEKQETLRQYVLDRGVIPAFADRCLNRAGDPCVPLGMVSLPLIADGDALDWERDPTTDDVDMTRRPVMLSTTFLQEWLLRVEGGSVVTTTPDLSVLELNDTATPGAPPDVSPSPRDVPNQAVLRFDEDAGPQGLWLTERLDLDLLADTDVDVSTLPRAGDFYLGFDRASATWQPREVEHPDPVDIPDVLIPTLLELPDTAVQVGGNSFETDIDAGDVLDGAVLRWRRRQELFVAETMELNDLSNVAGAPLTNQVLGWNGSVWQPTTVSSGSADTGDHVLARQNEPIAIVAAGVLGINTTTPGRNEPATVTADFVGQPYGNLRVATLNNGDPATSPLNSGGLFGGVVAVTFDGLSEAIAAFSDQQGRQFVVKVTPESVAGLVDAQIVLVHGEGIVIRFTIEKLGDTGVDVQLDTFLKNLDIDGRPEDQLRLHIEVSLYEDTKLGTAYFEAVPELGIERK